MSKFSIRSLAVAAGLALAATGSAWAQEKIPHRRQLHRQAFVVDRHRAVQEGRRAGHRWQAGDRDLPQHAARRRAGKRDADACRHDHDDLGRHGLPVAHRARTRGSEPALPVPEPRGRLQGDGRPDRRPDRQEAGGQGLHRARLHGARRAPGHQQRAADQDHGRPEGPEDPPAAQRDAPGHLPRARAPTRWRWTSARSIRRWSRRSSTGTRTRTT